ncbi:MAG: rRNA (uracil1939-C5)-methyltransferase [Clostridia bacterium]|nr:rRNA (uracil1939-C5)-methyltransferase [Clostridia bacterium]
MTEVTRIHGYSHAGEGVGRFEDKPVFIPFAARGEVVRFELTGRKKNLARGRLLEVLEPSPRRVTPFCPDFTECGGCHLQHLDYQEQLNFKEERVREALRRIGRLNHVSVRPILGMAYPWHYRHTARFHIRTSPAGVEIGYYRPQSHLLVPVKSCALLPQDFPPLLQYIKALLEKEKEVAREISEVVLRRGLGTGELMVYFRTNGRALPPGWPAAKKLAEAFPRLVSVLAARAGLKKAKPTVLYGRNYYYEHLAGLKFRVPGEAFFQVNPSQAGVLVEVARRLAGSEPKYRFLDLYCGVGLFGLALAGSASWVFGLEESRAAVEAARINAVLNGINNADFEVGRAEEVGLILEASKIRPDIVVLDPPRSGASPEVLAALAACRPAKMVYISCDPATLARDLALLAGQGYQVVEIQPVDMFPHTYHIECAALAERL